MDFKFLRKQEPFPGLCCLYLLPEKLIFAHALQNQAQSNATITFIEISIYQLQSLKLILESIVKKHHAQHVRCCWVLNHQQYQLLLLDKPEVNANEIAMALPWQIKDLINFPVEDAAIDYFSVNTSNSKQQKIYAIAAQKSQLQPIVDTIHDAELNLTSIDIPQLALRNLMAYYDDHDCYLSLLAFDHDVAYLIITHQKNLLLTRSINLPSNDLLLEVHRSFTYCQSQLQQPLNNKILYAGINPEAIQQLINQSDISCEPLAIEKRLNFDFIINQGETLSLEYLIAIGGALRTEAADATN